MIDINPNYAGAQWGVIDVAKLRKALRESFEKRDLTATKAENGRKTVSELCSYDSVSSKILGAIKQLRDGSI